MGNFGITAGTEAQRAYFLKNIGNLTQIAKAGDFNLPQTGEVTAKELKAVDKALKAAATGALKAQYSKTSPSKLLKTEISRFQDCFSSVCKMSVTDIFAAMRMSDENVKRENEDKDIMFRAEALEKINNPNPTEEEVAIMRKATELRAKYGLGAGESIALKVKTADGNVLAEALDSLQNINDMLVEFCNAGVDDRTRVHLDLLQESYVLLQIQLNKVLDACYCSVENGMAAIARGESDSLEEFDVKEKLTAEGGKMEFSTGVLSKITKEINPILERLETAANSDGNDSTLNADDLIAEANQAVEQLTAIRDGGIKTDSGCTFAPTTDINALICVLRDRVANMKIIAANQYAELAKSYERSVYDLGSNGVSYDKRPFIHRLQKIKEICEKNTIAINAKDYKLLLSGGINAGVLAYTTAAGLNSEHVDRKVFNLKKIKTIGSGAFNSVCLVTYDRLTEDGKIRKEEGVFKPVLEADAGMTLSTPAAAILTYKKETQAIENNVAAAYMANALGCNEVLCTSTFNVLDGCPGILMSKAEGIEASTFSYLQDDHLKQQGKDATELAERLEASPPIGVGEKGKKKIATTLTYAKKLQGLKEEQRSKILGGIMKSLNHLQWADALSGQVDRHYGNYLVNIDFENHTGSVTGIDNDLCCGCLRVGTGKFYVSMDTYTKLRKAYEKEFRTSDAFKGKGFDPKKNGKGEIAYYFCDMEKFTPGQRRFFMTKLGAYDLAFPSAIDRATYDNLMTINKSEYREKLKAVLNDDAAVRAAVLRLENAQAHAEMLAKKGCLVAEDEWENPGKQSEIFEWQKSNYKDWVGTDVSTMNDEKTAGYYGAEPFVSDLSFLITLGKKRA